MPRQQLNAIKSVDIAGKRQEPQKAIRALPDLVHARRQRAVLYPPGRMHVLGEAFVRIEGVDRACQKQYAGEITAY